MPGKTGEVKALVMVYRNLNRSGVVYSLKDTKTKLVIGYREIVVLKDCLLKVSQAGRMRVLKERRKNVHAGVVGTEVSRSPKGEWVRVRYNPYKTMYFETESGRKVLEAKYVLLNRDGCFVKE